MTLSNILQQGRTTKVFVKEETTKGSIIFPATGDFLVVSGAPEFNQTPSYTPSTEVRDSRSLRSRFTDKFPAGSWSIPMFVRPSGTLGAKPDGAVLFKGAFGVETVNAGVSVVYSLAKALPSLSIWVGMEDVVFAMIGATVNNMRITMGNKGAIPIVFSGGFMELRTCGKAEIQSHAAGVVTLKAAGDYKKYSVGMKVKFYDVSGSAWFTNTAAGYSITAVSSAGNTITVSPTISEFTPATDDIVAPFLPAGTEVGAPVEARLGSIEFGGSAVTITGAELELVNNVRYLEDEITSVLYPSDYILDNRAVTCKTSLFLRTEDLKYFYDGKYNTSYDLALKGGTIAGSKMAIDLNQCSGSIPTLSGDNERTLSIDFQALASATLEDEISITFN